MIDHTGINVSDFALSKAFFLKALAPLGYGISLELENAAGCLCCELEERIGHLDSHNEWTDKRGPVMAAGPAQSCTLLLIDRPPV